MSSRHLSIAWTAALLLLVGAGRLGADGPVPKPGDPIPMPTMGGQQFWADELFFHQWRIQRNAFTNHCRLLDGNDFRHASGTYEKCLATLEQIKQQRKLPPMRGKAVVVLHGLVASRSHMGGLSRYLREQGGYEVFNVTYPSTQGDIAVHAKRLAHIIDNLDGIEEINFVAHSLGNIIIRHYLGDQTDPANGRRPDPRIKRFVMLAPPNHGSLMAQAAVDANLGPLLAGEAVEQLGRDWPRLDGKLATPACQFGIIAGGKGDGRGYNLLLPGDNDGVIGVDTARLAGAADFVLVPVLHPFTMHDPKVQQYTLRFLQQGCFVSPQQRQPIK